MEHTRTLQASLAEVGRAIATDAGNDLGFPALYRAGCATQGQHPRDATHVGLPQPAHT